jgi:hypothetical protein
MHAHWRAQARVREIRRHIADLVQVRLRPTQHMVKLLIDPRPQCNGTGRCATSRAPRPVPLHHRANKAQMNPGLSSLPDETRGSGYVPHRRKIA